MKRSIVAGLAVLALAPLAAMPAAAGPPRHYHTITSTHGGASVTAEVEECLEAAVWVSSSVAMYASQPGPVNKQGLTGVLVQMVDTCTPNGAGMAGGGGGAVIFESDARGMVPLVVDNRLTSARVSAALHDVDTGEDVHLTVTWTGTGPLEHSTVVTHENLQPYGVVNSTANELRRAAVAEVSVEAGGYVITGTDDGATLEQTKSRCIEVPRPGVEGFYPCFGFPG